MSKETCEIVPLTGRIQIQVGLLEFNAGSNTIWIQSDEGATTLRIKCSGRINIERCKDSPVSHCDILVDGDINFCINFHPHEQ